MGHLLIFALILVSSAFAIDPPQLPSLGIAFIALVALVSAATIALATMVGQALQSPSITAWSKNELRQVIAGTILAVLIWSTVMGSSTIISTLFLQEGVPDLPSLGAVALDDHIEYMESLYIKVTDAYQTIGLFQGLGYFASLGGFWIYAGQGATPYFGLSILLGPLSTAANNLTMQILTFRLIQVFCEYLAATIPTFVLPIALAFRIFPFTRKMGNTLIALCLGAMFVFPLSLMFVNEFWHATDWIYKEDISNIEFTADDMDLGEGFMDGVFNTVEFVCGNEVSRVFLTLGEIIWSLIFAAIAAISCLAGYAACFVAYFQLFFWSLWPLILTFLQIALAGTILIIFNVNLAAGAPEGFNVVPEYLFPAVTEATGFSIVSIFMIIMITFAGTKSISAAIGGEYILYGISRFM